MRVNVLGVTSEVPLASLKEVLAVNQHHPTNIKINQGRCRSPVLTFASADEARAVMAAYNDEEGAVLCIGNIRLKVVPARNDDCWECRRPGHIHRNCPLLMRAKETAA
ncbi:hypothetical protein PHMEG_00028512 [Phytophthora megakarya]|uniref:CCHC-type domain-containing protein n=1 Tax=Phytophthora megakarya TaxID=4795 RepID=A0A225V4U4_9STRA|nr:hypothetical protein PHMEG_00028512 [Phytophthora megakarya]